MKRQEVQDTGRKNQANLRAALRGIVALYLISIAVRLAKDARGSTASMPVWAAWLIAAVFAFAGAFFGMYAWRSYRRDLETAGAPDKEESQDKSPKESAQSRSARPL